MSQIHSAPYRPAMACERCCFGSGEHADWCENGILLRQAIEAGMITLRRTVTNEEAKELATALGYRAGMTVKAIFEPDETED